MLSKKQLALSIGATMVGNALEWYEFYLYILFTPLFSNLFFPSDIQGMSLVQALLVIAIGFLSRPFGAILFGYLGDKAGRRIALVSSIFLMTIPTFLIGCVPTYIQIGIMAPLLILTLRLLQGIPTGGEFTGAMCYLYEISPPNRQGMMGSLVFFGSQIGAILSISEFLLLENCLTHHQIEEWGWRISFIIGGLIGFGGWYLRRKIEETPSFNTLKKEGKISSHPVWDSFQKHRRPMIRAFFLTALTVAGWYLVFIFSPLYASEIQRTVWGNELLITLFLIVLSNVCLPFLGWLGDKSYTRVLWIGSCLLVIVLAYPLYYFGMQVHFPLFLFLKIIMVIALTVQFALLPKLLCELFPPAVRYSSVGISYNIANVVVGGSSPFLALSLTKITGDPYMPMYILIACAFMSLFALPKKH
ncbi:MAG: MFS transporter [Chlamydiales bacterium]